MKTKGFRSMVGIGDCMRTRDQVSTYRCCLAKRMNARMSTRAGEVERIIVLPPCALQCTVLLVQALPGTRTCGCANRHRIAGGIAAALEPPPPRNPGWHAASPPACCECTQSMTHRAAESATAALPSSGFHNSRAKIRP